MKHDRSRQLITWLRQRSLALSAAAAAGFYVLSHLAEIMQVWPVHGVAARAGSWMIADVLALAIWGLALLVTRQVRYEGSWAIVVLPFMLFCLTRPSLFHVFTDPGYVPSPGQTSGEAWRAKSARARIVALDRAYPSDRRTLVFGDAASSHAPPIELRATLARVRLTASLLVPAIAPLFLLAGLFAVREPGRTRWFRRQHPRWFALGASVVLGASLVTRRGKVGLTTPWELALPLFVACWAATIADDGFNIARRAAFAPRRFARLLRIGAGPVALFVLIPALRDLGIAVVLAMALSIMLVVGTRQRWWAGVIAAIWAALIVAAFSFDGRSADRLELAYHLYAPRRSLEQVDAAKRWGELVYQPKLFDGNVLVGGVMGAGAGQGHGESAPNAADDGFVTLFAAQWGLVGGIVLCVVYTAFLIELLVVAAREPSGFDRSLVTGLTMLLATPFWLATLGGIRVVPLTGVAAAFVANGGAKLLAAAFSVGVIAGTSHRQRQRARAIGLDETLVIGETSRSTRRLHALGSTTR